MSHWKQCIIVEIYSVTVDYDFTLVEYIFTIVEYIFTLVEYILIWAKYNFNFVNCIHSF